MLGKVAMKRWMLLPVKTVVFQPSVRRPGWPR
jgi:hypothetical protein